MKNFIIVLTVFFISLQSIAQAKILEGEVVEVIGGDKFKLLTEEGAYVIFPAGAICPALEQSFGDKAKQFTSDAILNKFVKVEITNSWKKGYVAGIVYYDSINLSLELLRNGLAWHFAKSSNDLSLLQGLEDEARSNKIGLWQDTNPMHPKEWRETKANRVYPIYPGCEKKQNNAERKKCMSNKIKKFVNKNFRKNLVGNLDLDDGLQKISVKFNINVEGKIVDVEAIAPHPWLEKEAIRVFKKFPKIKPMLVKGTPVGSSHALAINVKK